ncbi:hypothetical protein [Aneurinibacillus aneurinilyticus]|uniref:hypothetical protein n=1 Tax=Aneurinibacillus aneurinilyticus TaxID=1391 RepID=UPI0035263D9D
MKKYNKEKLNDTLLKEIYKINFINKPIISLNTEFNTKNLEAYKELQDQGFINIEATSEGYIIKITSEGVQYFEKKFPFSKEYNKPLINWMIIILFSISSFAWVFTSLKGMLFTECYLNDPIKMNQVSTVGLIITLLGLGGLVFPSYKKMYIIPYVIFSVPVFFLCTYLLIFADLSSPKAQIVVNFCNILAFTFTVLGTLFAYISPRFRGKI